MLKKRYWVDLAEVKNTKSPGTRNITWITLLEGYIMTDIAQIPTLDEAKAYIDAIGFSGENYILISVQSGLKFLTHYRFGMR